MSRQRWQNIVNTVLVLAVIALLILSYSWVGAAPDTVTLRPDGVGDETNLTPFPNAGEANWEDVDEAVADDDTTYVVPGGGTRTDLYSIANSTAPLGKINSVTAYINALQDTAGASAATRIKTNAAAYDGTTESPGASYVTYSTAYTTNPQTSANWTWAEVNALQAGAALKKARVTQVWVVVDHTPASLESYKESAHSTLWGSAGNPYDNNNQTAYAYGGNFTDLHGYTVGYYDGNGTRVATDGVISAGDNTLSSQYILTADPGAAPGTWYAAVFDDDLGTPPNTYAEVSSAAGFVIDDSFAVGQEAIPEFPTVITLFVVMGSCFLIYYWMRKRRLSTVAQNSSTYSH